MLKLLAFDYGASSGRGILGKFDGSRLEIEEVHRFANEPVTVNGHLYWDILRLYHELKQGIHKCTVNGHKDIGSIGIDTWGVDFGLLDSEGNLLGNPFHYRDIRTEGMIGEAAKLVSKRSIYEETGIAFQKFNTLYQLLSMSLRGSPLLEKASTMLFIPDLLNYFLTGEKASEYTIASTAQMLDSRKGQWAGDMLKKLGIPQGILANIIKPGAQLGKLSTMVSTELGMGRVPVMAVAEHDTGSAVVSVPASQDRYAYISSGTWSLLGVEAAAPVINDDTYRLNYTNEGGFNNSIRLLKNIMGLWIYQECKRAWDKEGESTSFDQLEQEASKSTAFLSFIDPDDDMFYNPGGMPGKIREYCSKTGQRVPETRAEIVRCIMESLALKYKMALYGLENILGYTLPVLHIVGGGCKNVMLSQFTANAIDRPVITGPTEATAVGNLVAQLVALGEVGSLAEGREVVRNSFPCRAYAPADVRQWDEAYGRFISIIDKQY
ncbi:rhamnulokinase [Anaerobacterium chartisolvens]|uniref:Rhamnulokinase n=1 Tax=Anaerobacterium chartisolvens TaxID=1297424 RepID=A0A369AVJ9_9FIRM|nr:rhamnulokinase family protein [Anaerobacterium chartisolvens]RCX13221.1 rhamnulokinase [Anaerobacterium chartisolvens]